jgi:hypothetical protein
VTAREITRSDIEAALWAWSGWKADQRSVDELLLLVDRYRPVPDAPTVLEEARREAARIVDKARSDAALLLASPELAQEPAPVLRTCVSCGEDKPLSRFRLTGKGDGNRRRQCGHCEWVTRKRRGTK